MNADLHLDYQFSTYQTKNNPDIVKRLQYQQSKKKILKDNLFQQLETIQYLILDNSLVERFYHPKMDVNNSSDDESSGDDIAA